MRASGKQIGASVGKMVFHGQDAKRIAHRLEKIDSDKLKQALVKRGAGSIDTKDIAEAMSGKGRGWSQVKYKQVVAALQDVGVARTAKSASSMVLKASRNAQDAFEGPRMSPEQLKAHMKNLARERRSEAETEGSESSMGVLDRMRGAMGTANKGESVPVEQGKTVRETRELMRKDMALQPKIVVSKPKSAEDASAGFQV